MTSKPEPLQPLAVDRVQAARMLGVSTRTLDSLVSSGRLPASKVGRRTLIRVASLERLLADSEGR